MDTQPMFWRRPLPSCTGPCGQGRAPCPTPEACRLAVRDEDSGQHPATPQYTRRALTFVGVACFAIVCAALRACGVA